MITNKRVIFWFRQDLRLTDNPALTAALNQGVTLPLYILDDVNAGAYNLGGASRWWLYHSLQALKNSLSNNLSIYKGDPTIILDELVNRFEISDIYWNRCYEPWRIKRDQKIKINLEKKGVKVHSYNGSLLWEPWTIYKKDGTPYKVFTPFYRKGCLIAEKPRIPLAKPEKLHCIVDKTSISIHQLKLLPNQAWVKKLNPYWQIGEQYALKRVKEFIKEGLLFYKEGRNFPAKPYVSRLSPYLHFGEVSPNQLWHEVIRSDRDYASIDHFCSELGWREFSYSQLYYHTDLPVKNLQSKFDSFPWIENVEALEAWKYGQTGIPLVDAGMRELWETGYMHNRVRMIVSSFLVKNLLIHWHQGERWFWDTLVDADLANNSASWQWVAGCGADAAPYFRIFNPVTQGQKFDPLGDYVRQYVPEIASLPNKYLFSPWEAPENILEKLKIRLGITYPLPIVNLKESRHVALRAFQSLK